MRRLASTSKQIESWAKCHLATFPNAEVQDEVVEDGISKGGGLIAKEAVVADSEAGRVLLSLPADLVLSRARIREWARVDHDLRAVLEGAGEFAQSARGSILIFLLVQSTYLAMEQSHKERVGLTNPFMEYVRYLPEDIPLPTRWSEEERSLLRGTSLDEAVKQKLKTLDLEFEHLVESTRDVPWCQKWWWDENRKSALRSAWNLADARYRSRGLDLPGTGHAMVPLVDMANHASSGKAIARFEVVDDGDVMLELLDGGSLTKGQEITITYGTGGACEMLHSYGFLEEKLISAREMFLSLDVPYDDPLRIPKKAVADEAPGVRIYIDKAQQVQWESNLVWWACVNEEDGLDFQLIQSNDDRQELRAVWKNRELEPSKFRNTVANDEMYPVFQLRATVMVQTCLQEQNTELQRFEDEFQAAKAFTNDTVWKSIGKLRSLELQMYTEALVALEKEIEALLGGETVRLYLQKQQEEDLS